MNSYYVSKPGSMRGSVGIVALLLVLASRSHAQGTYLDQAETKIGQGAFAEARALLHRWQREQSTTTRPNPEHQARYHVLSARIITRADSAQDHYLTVALNYPTSRVAPEALLRLAQLHALRKDSAQAVQYFERLLNDYPGSDFHPAASAALARMRPVPAAKPAQNTKAAQPTKGRVAIQVGAFRELSGARAVKLQLERAGFSDVRLVRVPDNALIRVRIGKYSNHSGAAPVIARLQQKKFTAVVVSDVARESSVH